MKFLKIVFGVFAAFFLLVASTIGVIWLKCPECVTVNAKLGPISATTAPAENPRPTPVAHNTQNKYGLTSYGLTKAKGTGFNAETARANNIYRPGETIFYAAKPVNYGWSRFGGAFMFSMVMQVDVQTLDGKSVDRFERQVNIDSSAVRNDVFLYGDLTPSPEWPAGKYNLVITFREAAGKRAARITLPLEIAAPGAAA